MKSLKLICMAAFSFCTMILPVDMHTDAVESLIKVLQDIPPIKVQFAHSTESIVEVVKAIGDQLNGNVDGFFGQLGRSLPRVGPGIEALGRAGGNAMIPLRNQMFKGLAGSTTIIVSGALVLYLGNKYIRTYMFEPGLIAKKFRKGIMSRIASWFKAQKPVDLMDHMVISEQLKAELTLVMAMTTNIKKHGGQFDNILLAGAPGTGKTLFAQLLAEQCGMDYAIIPAANVSQFLANGKAVEELNNLFAWAAQSSNGTILFFDEAETFLADRRTLTSAAQNALSIFLAQTGTPSNKIMIICATNRPEILDEAVQSRFGIQIKFPLPDAAARYKQLMMHIKKIFGVQTGSHVAYDCLQDEVYVAHIAERIEGWSGRTIQKFVNRLRQQALAQGTLVIVPALVDQVIAQVGSKII